jgi:hypothetical protein
VAHSEPGGPRLGDGHRGNAGLACETGDNFQGGENHSRHDVSWRRTRTIALPRRPSSRIFPGEGAQGDNGDIYATPLSGARPLRLTTDPAEDTDPAWSPDGRRIAVIRRRTGRRADIMLIPALGGPEQKVREIRISPWMQGRILAWSPDGKWLCFTTEAGSSGDHVLLLLSPETGAVRQLLSKRDNGVGDSSPAFSADGRWLAFARFTEPFNSQLLLQPLSSELAPKGAAVAVKEAGINPKSVVWMPGGRQILFLDGLRIMQANIGRPARPFYASSFTFRESTMAGPALLTSLQIKKEEIWTIPLKCQGIEGPWICLAHGSLDCGRRPASLLSGWPLVSVLHSPKWLVGSLAGRFGRKTSAAIDACFSLYCRIPPLVTGRAVPNVPCQTTPRTADLYCQDQRRITQTGHAN